MTTMHCRKISKWAKRFSPHYWASFTSKWKLHLSVESVQKVKVVVDNVFPWQTKSDLLEHSNSEFRLNVSNAFTCLFQCSQGNRQTSTSSYNPPTARWSWQFHSCIHFKFQIHFQQCHLNNLCNPVITKLRQYQILYSAHSCCWCIDLEVRTHKQHT